MEGLRRRFGSFGNDNLELDIKYKGVPFLVFEVEKIAMYKYTQDSTGLSLLTIKDFCLMNMERSNIPSSILKSQNFELKQPSESRSGQKGKRPVFEIEDEDNIDS